jgi:hypothetical protein
MKIDVADVADVADVTDVADEVLHLLLRFITM